MNTSTYITFSAIDFRGNDSLSSYSLSVTPLTFIPTIDNTITTNFVWNFGDGTIMNAFSAVKYYKFPGSYLVTVVQYDCNTNAMVSTFTKTIQIYDYVPLTFNVDSLSSDLKCGQIVGPYTFNFYSPWYQPLLDIFYDFKNSGSKNFWDIEPNKFYHLDNFNCAFEKIYNYALSSYQYSELDRIIPGSVSDLYVKVSNGELISCSKNDSGACFTGSIGSKDVFIKDDVIKNNLTIDFRYDKTKYVVPFDQSGSKLNNFGISLSSNIIDNTPDRLSITSNGLDGEGFPITSFLISPIKFYDVSIPFVVRIKDSENFSVKNYNTIPLSALSILIECTTDIALATEGGELLLDEYGEQIYANGIFAELSSSNYQIYSLNNTLSTQNSGGSFRGYIKFNKQSTPLMNIRMSVSGAFINDQSSTYSLIGESNYFNVYPKNYFDLYKQNENFDATQTLKDLRFQEILLDKDVLFNNFFGDILGYQDLFHDDVGVKTYEKIRNFVQNTQDVDTCGIDFLDSLGEFVGYNDSFEEKYTYPEKVKRLVDLFSINKNKLLGYENKYNQNFDIRGHTSKDIYGINIGNKIDVNSYIVSTDTPIVALEKFSNEYILLNTFQPLSTTDSHTYPLTSYSSDWGWPLVLPLTYDFVLDIEKYYLFFEFVDQFDNTITDGVLDFSNSKTTIPFDVTVNALNVENGIKEHMMTDTLYQALSILN